MQENAYFSCLYNNSNKIVKKCKYKVQKFIHYVSGFINNDLKRNLPLPPFLKRTLVKGWKINTLRIWDNEPKYGLSLKPNGSLCKLKLLIAAINYYTQKQLAEELYKLFHVLQKLVSMSVLLLLPVKWICMFIWWSPGVTPHCLSVLRLEGVW